MHGAVVALLLVRLTQSEIQIQDLGQPKPETKSKNEYLLDRLVRNWPGSYETRCNINVEIKLTKKNKKLLNEVDIWV